MYEIVYVLYFLYTYIETTISIRIVMRTTKCKEKSFISRMRNANIKEREFTKQNNSKKATHTEPF